MEADRSRGAIETSCGGSPSFGKVADERAVVCASDELQTSRATCCPTPGICFFDFTRPVDSRIIHDRPDIAADPSCASICRAS